MYTYIHTHQTLNVNTIKTNIGFQKSKLKEDTY